MLRLLTTFGLMILLLAGCGRQEAVQQETAPAVAPETASAPAAPLPRNCPDCHAMDLDPNHAMACTICHQGHEPAATAELAHIGLNSRPAHPDRMAATCGPCHGALVEQAAGSLHFTLANAVNLVRSRFGATEQLASLTEIPWRESPATPLDLVDDLLRRRCLRCHVYYEGDDYGETRHGTGCAACHLDYGAGRLQSHRFTRLPADTACLRCHYGNRVGGDYYGRFEHDYSWDFRTPFATGAGRRPYGVEYHHLAPDIHRQKGLACIDCHAGHHRPDSAAIRQSVPTITCRTCHAVAPPGATAAGLPHLEREDDKIFLRTRLGQGRLEVPQLRHEAHQIFGDRVACPACHAQWGYNDQGTHLLRDDRPEADEAWLPVNVQGSSEVEEMVAYGFSGDPPGPVMADKISGAPQRGIWYKGFEQRRWTPLLLDRDEFGIVSVVRPLLDLHLSFVNRTGEVVFDNVGPTGAATLPYTPHTIGRAGLFYRSRLREAGVLPVEGNKVIGEQ